MEFSNEDERQKISPPNNKTSNLSETHKRWNQYKLPENMEGMSFLDIGCWAGGFCVEAVKRGAKHVLGIDMIKNSTLENFQKEYGFDFLICYILSYKFLEIPSFDIVFCGGVLYHVENPITLLFRLKTKVKQSLILESEIINSETDKPILQLFPENELGGNYSNWWVPNKICLEKMLESCEFSNINCVFQTSSRACFQAIPQNNLCKKILPRNEKFM